MVGGYRATLYPPSHKIHQNNQLIPAGLCNTVIDNPGRIDKGKLVRSILNFLETDTVLFYGEEPPELLQAQMKKWSPVILWFRERFGVKIEPTTEVISSPVQQGLTIKSAEFISLNLIFLYRRSQNIREVPSVLQCGSSTGVCILFRRSEVSDTHRGLCGEKIGREEPNF